jgi:hypothetical protein
LFFGTIQYCVIFECHQLFNFEAENHLKNHQNHFERDISKYNQSGDIMVMEDLKAHINGDEQDYIVNDSDDFLDDFLPQNYHLKNLATVSKKTVTKFLQI